MILYMRSHYHILKVSTPCSKGGLECAPEAKGNLPSSVTEPTAALTFQCKGVRDRLVSYSAFGQTEVRRRDLAESPAGVSGTVTCGRDGTE